jgi:hypothetical protein
MLPRVTRFVLQSVLALATSLALPALLNAQAAAGTVSGTITNAAGAGVANAAVSVKNAATGQTAETHTDDAGHYNLANLAPGDYELDVAAEGYSTNTANVTIAAGAPATADMTLRGALSLGDLGFSPSQTQGSAADQARLDKRSHMLKIHQRLGLMAAVPMVASLATSFGAGGRKPTNTDRWVHMGLGSATADLYFTSAYFAIRAPKIPGTATRGQIRLHKVLAWIHGPGMILTPILGGIAFEQKSDGQRVHGIASAHGPVAIVTTAAYIAAILSVSFKF